MEAIIIHLTSSDDPIAEITEISVYDSKGKLIRRLQGSLRLSMDLQSYCESLLISKYAHKHGGLIVIECRQGVDI